MGTRKRRSESDKAKGKKGGIKVKNGGSFLEENKLSALALISVAMLAVLWACKDIQVLPAWDGVYYMRYSLDSVFPPVYPFFIIIARSIVSPEVLAARVVSMVFLLGTVILVFFIAEHFASTLWALLASAFTAFAPLSLRLGTATLSEATYLFFIMLSAYLYVRTFREEPHKWELIGSGVASAAAYFTRPEAAVFFLVLLLIDAIGRKSLRRLAMMTGGFAVVFIMLVSLVYLTTGKLIITNKTSNFRVISTDWIVNEQMKKGGPVKPPTFTDIVQSTFSNYGTNLLDESSNLITYIGPLAILLCLWYISKKRTFLIAGLAEFFVLPIFTGLALPERLVYPYIPFIGIMAAAAISNFAPRQIKWLAVLLMLAGSLTGLPFLLTPTNPFPEQKPAGEFLKPLVTDTTIILDKKPYSTFFAGLGPNNYEEIPFRSIPGVIEYAKRTHASYLVLDKPVINVLRPQLLALFNPADRKLYASTLRLIGDINPGSRREVLVFRIM